MFKLDKEEVFFMDIKNAVLEKTPSELIEGQAYFGLRFATGGATQTLYNCDKILIDQWMTFLKQFCLLRHFNYYFEVKKVIGKGAFTTVHLAE